MTGIKLTGFAFALSLTAFFTACDPLGPLGGPSTTQTTFKPGTYDGFVIRRDGQSSAEAFLTGNVAQGTGSTLATGSFTQTDQTKFSVVINQQGSSLSLTFPGLSDKTLVVGKSSDCFASASSATVTGRVCLNGQGILVDFVPQAGSEIVLGVDFRSTSGSPTTQSQTYSLEQVLKAAKDQSFDSREKFEAAQASREAALQARLDLLPHFSVGDVFSFMSLSWTSAIKMVGELAPFLLPSSWINAAQATNQSDVDRDAFLIMQADSMNTAEGLVYSLMRDEKSLATLVAYEGPITQLRDEIANGEILGTQAPGTTNDLNVVLLSLDQMKSTLGATVDAGKRSISQSMGLMDPGAVLDVTVATAGLPSLDNPVVQDLATTQPLVLERSVELKQVTSMISLASNQLKGRWFDWINPSGGGAVLGPSFPASIKAGQDSVQEAMAERDKVQSTLLQNLTQDFASITQSLVSYNLAVKTLALQQARITQIENGIVLGRPISGPDLENAYQAAMQAEIQKNQAECDYYIAFANLNRLLYAGVYSQVVNQ
jgi:hypothetical protein